MDLLIDQQYFKTKLTEKSEIGGSKQEYERQLSEVFKKMVKAGFHENKKHTKFFMDETKRLGHEIY